MAGILGKALLLHRFFSQAPTSFLFFDEEKYTIKIKILEYEVLKLPKPSFQFSNYIYNFERCRKNNIITLEEIEAFDKIVKEINHINRKDDDAYLDDLAIALKSMPESQLKSKMQKR